MLLTQNLILVADIPAPGGGSFGAEDILGIFCWCIFFGIAGLIAMAWHKSKPHEEQAMIEWRELKNSCRYHKERDPGYYEKREIWKRHGLEPAPRD